MKNAVDILNEITAARELLDTGTPATTPQRLLFLSGYSAGRGVQWQVSQINYWR